MEYQRRTWSLKRAETGLAGTRGHHPEEDLESSVNSGGRNVDPKHEIAPKFRNVSVGEPALEIA